MRRKLPLRAGIRDSKPFAEFRWDGDDETSPAQGRGWAMLDGNEIEGMIFIHQGDESEFKAEKKPQRK